MEKMLTKSLLPGVGTYHVMIKKKKEDLCDMDRRSCDVVG